jgi:hypothetical protein
VSETPTPELGLCLPALPAVHCRPSTLFPERPSVVQAARQVQAITLCESPPKKGLHSRIYRLGCPAHSENVDAPGATLDTAVTPLLYQGAWAGAGAGAGAGGRAGGEEGERLGGGGGGGGEAVEDADSAVGGGWRGCFLPLIALADILCYV